MGRDGAKVGEWMRFVGVYVGGVMINFAVYSVVVWIGARRLVFRHRFR